MFAREVEEMVKSSGKLKRIWGDGGLLGLVEPLAFMDRTLNQEYQVEGLQIVDCVVATVDKYETKGSFLILFGHIVLFYQVPFWKLLVLKFQVIFK